MTIRILTGDCRDVLMTLPDASVDSIVTDPPYELGFMGKGWDSTGIANDPAMWAECLRVLKPGGHLLAFSGTRTYHRMVCAIEDAGFEIRDQIGWVYASGYPKSLDVSKQIDKAAGAEREVIAAGKPVKRMIPGADQNATGSWIKDNGREFVPTVTEPATDAARQWQGWGTALKPAWESIVVARKPLVGTVVANVLTHGTGAINVDACRIMQEGQERDADAYRRLSSLGSASYILGLSLSQIRGSLLHIASVLRSYSTGDTGRLRSADDLDGTLPDLALCERLVARLFPNGAWCGGSSWSVPDSLCGCQSCRHSCDEHTRLLREVAQGGAPSLADALERICSGRFGLGHNRECRCNGRLSSSDDSQLAWSFSFLVGEYCALYSATPQSARWPANMIHDGSDEVLQAFPREAGAASPVKGTEASPASVGNVTGKRDRVLGVFHGDTGSAARFFYCAKASKRDRNEGCEEMLTWESEDLSRVTECLRALQKDMSGVTTLLRDGTAWSMPSCGSSTTVQYLRAIRSIIETASKTTTESKTSNSSPHSNISESIRAAIETARASGLSLADLAGFTNPSTVATTDEQTASRLTVVHAVLLALSEISERAKRGNIHSTVKPGDLMRYLCRLVTPPGGTVLDPFAGSGSTLLAADREGFNAIGIELNPQYAEIARRRITGDNPLFAEVDGA